MSSSHVLQMKRVRKVVRVSHARTSSRRERIIPPFNTYGAHCSQAAASGRSAARKRMQACFEYIMVLDFGMALGRAGWA